MPVRPATFDEAVGENNHSRIAAMPTCPICADTMIAAEASAFVSDGCVSYLWSCETCGYGFVTKHSVKDKPCH